MKTRCETLALLLLCVTVEWVPAKSTGNSTTVKYNSTTAGYNTTNEGYNLNTTADKNATTADNNATTGDNNVTTPQHTTTFCPEVTFGILGLCGVRCENDTDCDIGMKCCPDACYDKACKKIEMLEVDKPQEEENPQSTFGNSTRKKYVTNTGYNSTIAEEYVAITAEEYNDTIAAEYNGTTTEEHNGTTSEGHNGTTTEGHNGTTTEEHNGTTPEEHNGTTPEEHNGTTPEEHNSTTTEQYNGTTVANNNATNADDINTTAQPTIATCPEVRFGFLVRCGIRCEYDTDCDIGMKCCPDACYDKACKKIEFIEVDKPQEEENPEPYLGEEQEKNKPPSS